MTHRERVDKSAKIILGLTIAEVLSAAVYVRFIATTPEQKTTAVILTFVLFMVTFITVIAITVRIINRDYGPSFGPSDPNLPGWMQTNMYFNSQASRRHLEKIESNTSHGFRNLP